MLLEILLVVVLLWFAFGFMAMVLMSCLSNWLSFNDVRLSPFVAASKVIFGGLLSFIYVLCLICDIDFEGTDE